MSKIGQFIVWAEENNYCEYDALSDDLVWNESYRGEAYDAYLKETNKEKQNE